MLRTVIQIGVIVVSAALPAQAEGEPLGLRGVVLIIASVAIQKRRRTGAKNIVQANEESTL
jgi:hypothetical protein